MTAEEYEEYRRSPWWRQFSISVRQHFGKCAHCGFKYELNVHHKTYERLGKEKLSDVVVLCRSCHSREHFKDNIDSMPAFIFDGGSKSATVERLKRQQETARIKNRDRADEVAENRRRQEEDEY